MESKIVEIEGYKLQINYAPARTALKATGSITAAGGNPIAWLASDEGYEVTMELAKRSTITSPSGEVSPIDENFFEAQSRRALYVPVLSAVIEENVSPLLPTPKQNPTKSKPVVAKKY